MSISIKTTIISKADYALMENEVGTIMFGDKFYDCSSYVDLKKVRKNFNIKGRIKIIVMTKSHPDFKNKSNKDIPYKSPVCAGEDYDGAYTYKYGNGCGRMTATDFPLGDAFIVV